MKPEPDWFLRSMAAMIMANVVDGTFAMVIWSLVASVFVVIAIGRSFYE